MTGQMSTQAAADGSSYLEMGNTKVMCTVTGPSESSGGGGGRNRDGSAALVQVEVGVAGFSGVDRKRRAGGRGDKSVSFLPFYCALPFAFAFPFGLCFYFMDVGSRERAINGKQNGREGTWCAVLC